MEFLLAAMGLVILLLAGDVLVRGAVNVSLRLGVPALIVSLTIVAFGTSAPELLIAIKAVLDNAPGIAMGNVVGSNTANVLLVLGVPALISGLGMKNCEVRKSYVFMLIATLLFIMLAFMGPISWPHGLALLGMLALVLGDQLREALAHRQNGKVALEEDLEGADPNLPWWRILLYLALRPRGVAFGG